MSFLAPALLVLAALGVVIAIFHTRRPRDLEVPSLMIWKRLEAVGQGRNWIWRWPQLSWPLLLQMLALLALVGALAQPLWGQERDVEHWVYVLDNSIAMTVAEDGISRHERALARLADEGRSATGHTRYSLLSAGVAAEPVFVRQAALPGLFDGALGGIAPDDGPADWQGINRLLAGIVRPNEVTHLVMLAAEEPALDRAFADLRRTDIGFGGDVPGAALTARLEPDGEQWRLSGDVAFAGGLERAALDIGFVPDDGEAQVLKRLDLMAEGGRAVFAESFDLPGAGVLTASLSDDAGMADNRADFALKAGDASLKLLYLGGADEPPLLRALEAVGGFTVSREGTEDADGFDLVVVDNVTVDAAPKTNVVWIGSARLEGEAQPEALNAPVPTGWHGEDALARSIVWTGLTIDVAFGFDGEGWQKVLEAGSVPLIATRQTASGQDIRIAFDPAQSNWPEQAGFAVFAANLVDALGLGTGGRLEPVCRVGESCVIDGRLVGGAMNGEPIPADHFVPQKAGLYVLEHEGRSQRIAVHAKPAEADVMAASAAGAVAPSALWPWLIGAAGLLLLAEIVIAGFGSERFLKANGGRRWQLLGLRGVAIICALFALLDLPLPFYRDDGAVVAVTDGDTDLPAVVPGAVPMVADKGGLAGHYAGWGRDALQLAAALLPPDMPGRLLVETTARAEDLAPVENKLRRRAVPVDSHEDAAVAESDVLLAGLEAPGQLYAGDSFALTGIVRARMAAEAEVSVSRDGEELSRQKVQLHIGANRISVPVTDIEPGAGVYDMRVDAAGDPEPGNNADGVAVLAEAPGTIAILAAEPRQGEAFARALQSQGLATQLLPPSEAPTDRAGWQRYAGAVMMNVPAIALTIEQQSMLERAVAEDGLGLLILGGANSFGPGGYLETPLDKVSPISSRIPRDRPGVALVFVLDRSSSMTQEVGPVTRLDVAKQATIDAIALLDEESQVAVVTFDSRARLSLPMSGVDQKDFIARSINQITPGGGTAMYRGLTAGFDQLRNVDASARHIVVMTDGLSQPGDFPGLMANIREAGVTVSSVAIGEESELELVEQIARDGGGVFHATTDFAALPSILSQEAMMLSGDPIETVAVRPDWVDREQPFLEGLPDEWPEIEGYVLTTPKPEATALATVLDTTGKPVPLLSSWRYGNGQVLAMTTDIAGEWTRGWQQSADYPRLFAQTLRQFLPARRPGFSVDVERRGDTLTAIVEAETGLPSLTVTAPGGEAELLPLAANGAGRYLARFVPETPGAHRFTATLDDDSVEAAAYVGYPARLDWAHPDHGGQQLALATGGTVLAAGAPYAPAFEGRWTGRSIWPIWLGLALCFFMLDLMARYAGFDIFRRVTRSKSTP